METIAEQKSVPSQDLGTVALQLKVESIARICHEANRAFCITHGDTSHVPWYEATKELRESAREGVRKHLANPDFSYEDSHASWMYNKIQNGWVYGPVKDSEKKTHPCIVPYDKLSESQKQKDRLFKTIVDCFRNHKFAN